LITAVNTTYMEELQVLMEENDICFDTIKQQHFRCFAHILNLDIQDTLKLIKLQDIQ